ncbi:MAG: caspase family protein [Candidatus Dadabacteria bacterium]|nr:MAG: caspase family protein [Candidatus Dadabacteria bacterium]
MKRYVFLIACIVLSAFDGAAATTSPQTWRVAVIVGNNRPLDQDLSTLFFADDDALQMARFWSAFADEVHLLTDADPDTLSRYPAIATAAETPTRDALDRALQEAFTALERARKRGARTELVFYFSGHGSVNRQGVGYLHLADARFSRSDLYARVLARSPADRNLVIIDACNSGMMIRARGAEETAEAFRRTVQALIAAEDINRYPNTGLLLSTALAETVHEWSVWRGGVFSYILRSGLSGGADIDGNGQIDWSEIHAWIDAADSRVSDADLQLHAEVRPDQSSGLPVLDLNRGRGLRRLTLPAGRQRLTIWDRDVRWLDVHADAATAMTLWLPADRALVVEQRDRQAALPEATQILLAQLDWRPRGTTTARGNAQPLAGKIFAEPFSPAFLAGWRTAWNKRSWLAAASEQAADESIDPLPLLLLPPDTGQAAAGRWFDWLGEALHDRLIAALDRTRRFDLVDASGTIIGRRIRRACEGSRDPACVQRWAAQQRVALLEVRLRTVGNTLALSVQIVDPATGRILAADALSATDLDAELLWRVEALAQTLARSVPARVAVAGLPQDR